MFNIRIKILNKRAKVPTYAHEDDAGMDLYAAEAITLAPGEYGQVKTGIALAIPGGHVGLIWDKSGVAQKRGIKTLGGVVDAGYRGEILVGLVNLSTETQTFSVGDKVAQMLIQHVLRPELDVVEDLDVTPRGLGGFGSTGV